MNKKLLSSCLVLSICAIALAPIYKQLDISNNKTVQSYQETAPSSPQQLKAVDYTVTYPQDEEKEEVINKPAVSTTTQKTVANTTTKKSTDSKTSTNANSSTKSTTTTKKTTSKTEVSKQVASKTVISKPAASKPVVSTSSNVNRSTSTSTTSTAASPKVNSVISTAKNYLGVPYVWGGESPSGFDCSGFIQYVLMKNGISVPRTAAEQYSVGTSVSKSNLRVGDLVFFTTYKAGPSHLGFYMGSDKFIHASSSKGVTISSLSSTYYSSRYIGARRVIN